MARNKKAAKGLVDRLDGFDPEKNYEPDTDEWEIKAGYAARNFAPQIIECGGCRQPTVEGWCCMWCDDDNPTYSWAQRKRDAEREVRDKVTGELTK